MPVVVGAEELDLWTTFIFTFTLNKMKLMQVVCPRFPVGKNWSLGVEALFVQL